MRTTAVVIGVLAGLLVLAGASGTQEERKDSIEELVDALLMGSARSARLRTDFQSKPPKTPEDVNAWLEAGTRAEYPSTHEPCARARLALLERDREGMRAVLAKLEALDLGSSAGEAGGQFLTSWLTEACCGGFGWSVSFLGQDVSEDNAAVVEAWSSLWERVRDDEEYWRLPRSERGKACAQHASDFVPVELAMKPSWRIRANTREGQIVIEADAGFGRAYTWNGDTRTAVLYPPPEAVVREPGALLPGSGEPLGGARWPDARRPGGGPATLRQRRGCAALARRGFVPGLRPPQRRPRRGLEPDARTSAAERGGLADLHQGRQADRSSG